MSNKDLFYEVLPEFTRETEALCAEEMPRYHGNRLVSSTWLITMLKEGGPGVHERHIQRKRDIKKTKYMTFGQVGEDIVQGRSILIPEEGDYDERRATYRIQQHTGRSKIGKEEIAAAEADGIHLLPKDLAVPLERGTFAAMQSREVQCFNKYLTQQPIYRREANPGSPWPNLPGIQARPDWAGMIPDCPENDYYSGKLVFADLKTTSSIAEFPRTFIKNNYHVQAGMVRICSGTENLPFVVHAFPVIERSEPNDVYTFYPDEELIQTGIKIAKSLLSLLDRMFESNHFGARPLSPVISAKSAPWVSRDADNISSLVDQLLTTYDLA